MGLDEHQREVEIDYADSEAEDDAERTGEDDCPGDTPAPDPDAMSD